MSWLWKSSSTIGTCWLRIWCKPSRPTRIWFCSVLPVSDSWASRRRVNESKQQKVTIVGVVLKFCLIHRLKIYLTAVLDLNFCQPRNVNLSPHQSKRVTKYKTKRILLPFYISEELFETRMGGKEKDASTSGDGRRTWKIDTHFEWLVRIPMALKFML